MCILGTSKELTLHFSACSNSYLLAFCPVGCLFSGQIGQPQCSLLKGGSLILPMNNITIKRMLDTFVGISFFSLVHFQPWNDLQCQCSSSSKL